MKHLLLLLALFIGATAYSQCSEFDNLLKQGDNYLRGNRTDYQEAINAYTAAILACGDRAGEAKLRITKMVVDINRLTENAVAAKKKVSKTLEQVEEQKTATEEQRRRAKEEQQKTEETLKKLQEANEDFVRGFLQNARKDMSGRRCKDALEKIKTAAELGVLKEEVCNVYLENADSALFYNQFEWALESLKAAAEIRIPPPEEIGKTYLYIAEKSISPLQYELALESAKAVAALGVLKLEVSRIYLEIAFWHGEAGNTLRATGILDSAALLLGKKIDRSTPHRIAIETLDPIVYKKLMERYYPVMVPVEGGIFDMGCDPGDRCEDLHKQEVSSFQMAKYETTWWQYFLFCKATGNEFKSPEWSAEGDNPAVNVSWYDATAYCNWVSKQLGKREIIAKAAAENYSVPFRGGYRLPTEAEWEYAAGGGIKSRTQYAGTDDEGQLENFAWYSDNAGGRTQKVGTRNANPLGLHDMSGNVWEWCWDRYGDYPKKPQKDYLGLPDGSRRVVRGGSWDSFAERCRTAGRYYNNPGHRNSNLGFRLVFVP
jgi:formylglycine-generating enzyme required for sulfatase activity